MEERRSALRCYSPLKPHIRRTAAPIERIPQALLHCRVVARARGCFLAAVPSSGRGLHRFIGGGACFELFLGPPNASSIRRCSSPLAGSASGRVRLPSLPSSLSLSRVCPWLYLGCQFRGAPSVVGRASAAQRAGVIRHPARRWAPRARSWTHVSKFLAPLFELELVARLRFVRGISAYVAQP